MDDLYAAVIHDIKNQLAELALRLERRGDCAQETAILFAASQRLSGLLLAQRQQAGLLQIHVDSDSPTDLLQEVAAEHRTLFPNVTIEVDYSAAPPFWFYDKAMLRLALDNALHNACRHARNGVRLEARKVEDMLEIKVTDDGQGFPDSMLAVDSGASPTFASRQGTGLGLYLASKIAQLHKNKGKAGSVELANDEGAVFLIRLP